MIEDTFAFYPAPMVRRVIAAILDIILLLMLLFIFFEGLLLVVGQFIDLSVLQGLQQQYYDLGVQQGVFSLSISSSFDAALSTVISSAVYSAISIDSSVYSAFVNHPEVVTIMAQMNEYFMVLFWSLLGAAFAGSFLTYFIVPLFFKNGQTFGKTITKLMVVTKVGGKVQVKDMIKRYFLGIFAIDILLSMLVTSFFGMFPVILFIELFVVFSTKNNSALHDLISGTLVVDANREKMAQNEEKENDSRAAEILESEALRKKLAE